MRLWNLISMHSCDRVGLRKDTNRGGSQMVNDPEVEREDIGGREPMGDPAEVNPTTREGGDYGETDAPDEETLTEGTTGERLGEEITPDPKASPGAGLLALTGGTGGPPAERWVRAVLR